MNNFQNYNDNENNDDQNLMIQQILEQYQQTKKQNQVLTEKLDKLQSDYSIEISKEKDLCQKTNQELKKQQKQVKDLKIELQNLQAQLMGRENEIRDLQRRLELKSIIDEKNKDRDNNLFIKFLGRKATPQDQKLIAFINHHENQKDKLDSENKQLQKQLHQLKEKESCSTQQESRVSNYSFALENQLQEFKMKVNQMSNENQSLFQENKKLQEEKQFLQEQNGKLITQGEQLKQLYHSTKQELIDQFNAMQRMSSQKFPPKMPIGMDSDLTLSNRKKKMCEQSFSQASGRKQRTDQNKENYPEANCDGNSKETGESREQIIRQRCCIERLFEIFNVFQEEQLVQAAEKIGQVMQSVQKLEQFCRQICDEVLEDQEGQDLDKIIPKIRKMKHNQKFVESSDNFKNQLMEVLGIDPNDGDEQSIFDFVVSLQEQLEQANVTSPLSEVLKLFNISHEDNLMVRMNQIWMQLQDIQKFSRIAKRILELDEQMRMEACLTYILKLLEKMKLQEFNDPDLMWKCCRLLGVEKPSQILQKLQNKSH